jgi:RNA polymerase sigma-70 factor (ECF subfamily)
LDWEQTWRTNWEEIYRYIYSRVRHRQEAEDLTQETFIKVMRAKPHDGEAGDNVIALLKTTARNLIIDRWRKQQNRGDSLPLDDKTGLSSPGKDPGELAEIQDEVRRAMALLTPAQRDL